MRQLCGSHVPANNTSMTDLVQLALDAGLTRDELYLVGHMDVPRERTSATRTTSS